MIGLPTEYTPLAQHSRALGRLVRADNGRDQLRESTQCVGLLQVIGMSVVDSFDTGNGVSENPFGNVGSNTGSRHE